MDWTWFDCVARVAGTADEQDAGEQSGGEFAALLSKVLGSVSNTINVRFEPNDIVACRELPARNKRASKIDHRVLAE